MKLLKRTTALVVVALLVGTAGCNNPTNDAAITTRVKHAISKEAGLRGTKVSVSTEKKVVHLSGTVKSRDERAMLIAVTRKVEGVKGIKTDLVVQAQQKTAIQKPAVAATGKREVRAQQRVTARAVQPPER